MGDKRISHYKGQPDHRITNENSSGENFEVAIADQIWN